MSVVLETETIERALSLPESARARLADALIRSLPSPFSDDDDGVDEAIRRSREMNENPPISISHKEFMKSFEEYRRQ